MSERFKIERNERGESWAILNAEGKDITRHGPDYPAAIDGPGLHELVRLAAEEERSRIVDEMERRIDEAREQWNTSEADAIDAASSAIQRGEHWKRKGENEGGGTE